MLGQQQNPQQGGILGALSALFGGQSSGIQTAFQPVGLQELNQQKQQAHASGDQQRVQHIMQMLRQRERPLTSADEKTQGELVQPDAQKKNLNPFGVLEEQVFNQVPGNQQPQNPYGR